MSSAKARQASRQPNRNNINIAPPDSAKGIPEGEILTPNRGWVDISMVNAGDEVFGVGLDGALRHSRVLDLTTTSYYSYLLEISARGLTMILAPSHPVVKVGGTRGHPRVKYSIVPISMLPGQATILRSVSWQGQNIPEIEIEKVPSRARKLKQPQTINTYDYAALVGWYISEGNRLHRDKGICISQIKRDGRGEIESLLDRIGFKYIVSRKDFYIHCMDLYEHFAQYGDGARNKRLPSWFKSLSDIDLDSFYRAAMLGDGSESYYYTTSSRLADDMCEVALKTGLLTYMSKRHRSPNRGILHQISTKRIKSGGTEILTGNHVYHVSTKTKRRTDIMREKFCGTLYNLRLIDLPAFVVRQKGSVWISGGS